MKKSGLYSIILGLIFWVPSISFSQSFRFKNYGVNDGLPSSETYHVMQDSKGYIWVSGDMGVSRFNGYEFQNFSTKDGLPDNVIFESYEDHEGRIWFRSISGKLAYYYNDSIKSLPVNDELTELLNKGVGIIYSMVVDPYDTLWLGIYRGQGPIKISLNDFKIKRMKIDKRHYMIDVAPGQVIFGDIYDIPVNPYKKIEPKEGEVFFYSYPRNLANHDSVALGKEMLYHNGGGIRSIAIVNEKKRYIAHTSKCAMIENDKVFSAVSYKTSVNSLYYSKGGGLWVSVLGDGVYYYPEGDITGTPALHLFKGKTVSSVCRGAEGGYFFSTTADGLFYTPNIALVNYDASNKLTENRLQAVLPTSQNTWLGYYHSDGVDIIYDSLKIKKEIVLKSGSIGDANTILKHSDGTVWVSSTSGISIFSANYPFNTIVKPGEYANKNIGLSETDSGYVWGIGLNNLNLLKRNNNKIKSYKNFVSKSRLSCVYVTKDHKVYVGTANGVLQHKTDSLLQTEDLDLPQLKTKIISIKENSKGQLFIATKESGVFIKSENKLTQIGPEQGMLSGVCRSLFIDSLDNAWVGTNVGLSRIKQKEAGFQVTNYTEKGGLASNEVNDIKVFAGKVYVATNGGLTLFDIDKKLSNEVPPPIYITGIHIHNENKTLQSSYELKYNQNFLIVDYIGLTYKDAGNVQYRYKLTGVDTNWVYTKYRSVQYPTLPPGNYVFNVAAMNNDGIWSNTPATFNIHISPPWWETWWFRIAAILSVAGFVYWRIRRIETIAREKTELNKQVSEMELKALRSQMNPHFIFNAINSIQHFILQNEQEEAHKYLSKFSKLIRNVLDNSRKPLITVEHESETLNLYMELEALRFEEGNKFTYRIELDDKIDAHEVAIPSMLIQPYIENAIWHGLAHLNKSIFLRQGFILVRIEEVNHELIKCIVQDNGIGRAQAADYKSHNKVSHKSVGMEVTKERLDLINKTKKINLSINIIDLKDENSQPQGTRVEIFIPVK